MDLLIIGGFFNNWYYSVCSVVPALGPCVEESMPGKPHVQNSKRTCLVLGMYLLTYEHARSSSEVGSNHSRKHLHVHIYRLYPQRPFIKTYKIEEV